MSEAILRTALEQMLSEFDADEFSSEGQMAVCYEARQALAALDSRAGDAGEERDALLAALGWKTGPFSDPATRRVILEDTAGLRPEMVKARRRAQEAEGSSMMWYSIIGEFVHDSRSGVLGRMWNEVKRLRAQVRKLQAATPAPAVDAQEGDDEGPCTDCWDTGITIQTERACSCEAGDQYRAPAVDAVPAGEVERLREALTPSGDTKAAYHGEFRFDVMFPSLDEDDDEPVPHPVVVPWDTVKEIMAAISSRAALSHGEGRK